jgi:hypothetical protein
VHAPHRRQVDHQTVVAAAEPGAVVATTSDSDEQTLVAAEVHGSDDIGDVHATRDQKRSLVDHAIVQFARLLVTLIATLDQLTAQVRLESLYGCFAQHDVLLFSCLRLATILSWANVMPDRSYSNVYGWDQASGIHSKRNLPEAGLQRQA